MPILWSWEGSSKRATDSTSEALSLNTQATDLSHIEVYLDDFIGIMQRRPLEIHHIMQYRFCAINDIFSRNDKNNTAHKQYILIKNSAKATLSGAQKKSLSDGLSTPSSKSLRYLQTASTNSPPSCTIPPLVHSYDHNANFTTYLELYRAQFPPLAQIEACSPGFSTC